VEKRAELVQRLVLLSTSPYASQAGIGQRNTNEVTQPGKYIISTPIIQYVDSYREWYSTVLTYLTRYYYTQFIGDANDVPIIAGSANFSGIALIDTDVYIPGADGLEWCEFALIES